MVQDGFVGVKTTLESAVGIISHHGTPARPASVSASGTITIELSRMVWTSAAVRAPLLCEAICAIVWTARFTLRPSST